jgi:regulator of replication initiation timing
MSSLETRLENIKKAVERLMALNITINKENLELKEALNKLQQTQPVVKKQADISAEANEKNIKIRQEVDAALREVEQCIDLVKSMD